MEEAEKFLCSVSVLVQILHRVHVRFYCQLQPPVGICQKQNQSTDTCQGAWQQGNRSGVFTNAVSVLPRSMRNGIQLAYSVVKLSSNDKRKAQCNSTLTKHTGNTELFEKMRNQSGVQRLSRRYPACTLKNRHSLKKIQETVYTGQWRLSPLPGRYLGTSHSSPSTISHPVVFSWISLTIWNLFSFKGDFSFGKSQKLQGVKSGL